MPRRAAKTPEGRLVLRDEGKPQVELALYRMGKREPVGAVLVPRDMLAWYAQVLLTAGLRPVERAAVGEPAAPEVAVRSGHGKNAREGSGSA